MHEEKKNNVVWLSLIVALLWKDELAWVLTQYVT
jgi:hypothetical protein